MARLSVARRIASSARATGRMSCPPTSKSSQPGRSRWANSGNSVTSPQGWISFLFNAQRPTIVVAATPPFAPINQTPRFGFAMIFARPSSNPG